ncbi:RNA polymerase II C-terminal domain phosphatase-like 1 [Cucumis melo var. makuwa]|uniref:RNA polymerase II C-terminal domain phosphatase-like 1 n=1 Tax=Cucumis melo var. makuwa TaxID=1194695 RepID=A0A5D3C7A8_CUCMM|nr:RNA polymerase II C-terminal domain phosphatase-like 1 [Cucumis melo var. makuwa]
MVSEWDIEETLDNQTLDGTLTKGTAVDISAIVAIAVDAQISAAMDEWFRRLQNPPASLLAKMQPFANQEPSAAQIPHAPTRLAANLSGCLEVGNPARLTFEIAAIEATLGDPSYNRLTSPVYYENLVTSLLALSQSIKMILEGHHKFGFLTGEIPRSTSRDSQEQYWKEKLSGNEPGIAYNTPELRRLTRYMFYLQVAIVFLEEDRTNAMSSLSNPGIDFAAFSVRSPSHDSEKHNGKPILVCEHCKKQWHTKEQCWKLHGCPPRGKKCPSNDKQNTGRVYMSEFASPSQLRGDPSPTTLGAMPSQVYLSPSVLLVLMGRIP